MLRSVLELNSLIVWLLVTVAVLFFAVFVMVLISFLNNRREREASEIIIQDMAARLEDEEEKSVAAIERAEEAEREHRADLALLQSKMAGALEALRVVTQQPAALQSSRIAPMVQAQPTHPNWALSSGNGRMAVQQGAQRVALTAVPDKRHTRPPQIAAALTAGGETVTDVGASPTAGESQPNSYVYQPTQVFAETERSEPEKAPDPNSTTWFDARERTQNGGRHDSPEERDQLSASPVDDPTVPEGDKRGHAEGADDEGHLGPETREDGLTEPDQPTRTGDVHEEQTSAAVATEETEAKTEDDTPAFGLAQPDDEEPAIDPKAMVDDLKALSGELATTLSNIPRSQLMADWTPPKTVTNMNPVDGPDNPANTE